MYLANTNVVPTTIFLNTRYAATRSPTYAFPLAQTISVTNDQFFLVTLTEFVCVNTIANVDGYNNTLVIGKGAETIIVTLREVNHTISSLISDINQQLTSHDIQAVFNASTLRITFYSNAAISILPATTCGLLIGVARSITNDWVLPLASGLTPAYSIEMPECINLTGTSFVNLRVNNFSVQSFSPSGLATQVFARIPMLVNYGSTCVYRPIEPLRFPIQAKMIDAIDITISNEQGRSIPMSFDFQVQFTFHTLHHFEERDSSIGTITWFMRTKVKDIMDDTDETDSTLVPN